MKVSKIVYPEKVAVGIGEPTLRPHAGERLEVGTDKRTRSKYVNQRLFIIADTSTSVYTISRYTSRKTSLLTTREIHFSHS